MNPTGKLIEKQCDLCSVVQGRSWQMVIGQAQQGRLEPLLLKCTLEARGNRSGPKRGLDVSRSACDHGHHRTVQLARLGHDHHCDFRESFADNVQELHPILR